VDESCVEGLSQEGTSNSFVYVIKFMDEWGFGRRIWTKEDSVESDASFWAFFTLTCWETTQVRMNLIATVE